MHIKTVHITNAYHPTSGGISTFYRALMTAAERHGRQLRLIVPGEETRTDHFNSCSLIYTIKARPSRVGDSRYRLLWPWGDTGNAMADILRHEQPQVVEIGDKYTLPYMAGFLRRSWVRGMKRKPKLVAISHERMDHAVRSYLRWGGIGDFLSGIYLKQFYFPMFDWHAANSRYTAEELLPASFGHRLYREIRVMPMGVDCDAFDPARRTPGRKCEPARRLNIPCGDYLLVYAGRLSWEKNLDLIVGMMGELDARFRIVIAGEGDLRADLERRLGERARFTGYLQGREQLAELLAAADAFVHPNPREPFGIAPLEAMAAGTPVIVPNAGGVLTYANAENAWLAAPTPADFAAAAKDIVGNGSVTQLKLKKARETAEQFSWPHIADRFFEFFDEVAATEFPVPIPIRKPLEGQSRRAKTDPRLRE